MRSSCQTSWSAFSIAQEGISFAKDPLGSGSSFFEVLSQHHLPVHLSMQSTNKTKRMPFEPRIHYCQLVYTSVRYERKMHVLSKIVIAKNPMCFNFVEIRALRSFFYTKIFQIYGIHSTMQKGNGVFRLGLWRFINGTNSQLL